MAKPEVAVEALKFAAFVAALAIVIALFANVLGHLLLPKLMADFSKMAIKWPLGWIMVIFITSVFFAAYCLIRWRRGRH